MTVVTLPWYVAGMARSKDTTAPPPPDPTPEEKRRAQAAERQRRLREKRKAEGGVSVSLIVPKAAAARLRRAATRIQAGDDPDEALRGAQSDDVADLLEDVLRDPDSVERRLVEQAQELGRLRQQGAYLADLERERDEAAATAKALTIRVNRAQVRFDRVFTVARRLLRQRDEALAELLIVRAELERQAKQMTDTAAARDAALEEVRRLSDETVEFRDTLERGGLRARLVRWLTR